MLIGYVSDERYVALADVALEFIDGQGHSVEPYHLELFRYGWTKERVRGLGWYDEHGPRAVMQITPDGDYTQTGVGWNKIGYGSAHHTQFVTGPEKSGLYYLHAKGESSGEFFSFPWI